MINGIHFIIYSKDAEADKAFFKNIMKLTNVDVGHGWLIFGLPPAELAIHPASTNNHQEMYLMCDDIVDFVEKMSKHKIKCSKIQQQGWGQMVQITLPGGGKLGIYQPRHERPKPYKVKAKQLKSALSKDKIRTKK